MYFSQVIQFGTIVQFGTITWSRKTKHHRSAPREAQTVAEGKIEMKHNFKLKKN